MAEQVTFKNSKQIRTMSLVQDSLDCLPDTRIKLSALRQSEEGPKAGIVPDQQESYPKWLDAVRKISGVLFAVAVFFVFICAAAGLASGGYETPLMTFPSLIAAGISFAVLILTEGSKAWMRRQAWIQRMRQQDAEKCA